MLPIYTQAQDFFDSLKTVIDRSEGIPKAEAWMIYGLEWELYDLDSGVAFLDSAATIYKEADMHQEWLISMGHKIRALEYQGRYLRAYRIIQTIQDDLPRIDSVQIRGMIRNSIARTEARLGNPEVGTKMLKETLAEFKEIKDTIGQVETLESLAMEYSYFNSSSMAIEYQDSALSLAESYSLRTEWLMWPLYNNAASFLIEGNRVSESKPYIEKSISEAEATEDPTNLLYPYFTMGEALVQEGSLSQAIPYFKKAADYLDDLYLEYDIITSTEARSIHFALLGNHTQSEQWLTKCLAKQDSIGSGLMKFETLIFYSDVQASLGRFENALKYYQLASHVKDTLFSQEKARQTEELQIMYQADRAEQENQRLKEANEATKRTARRNIQFFLVIIGLILLSGLGMVYLIFKLRKLNRSVLEQNQTLADQNDQLKQLTSENELLMGIVAHDLKAPLNKIAGLTGLIPLQGDINEDQRQSLALIDRVVDGGKELVTDILILSEAGEEKKPNLTAQDLSSVIRPLKDQFKEALEGKSLSLLIMPPPQMIEAHIHPPYLTRILDNLISNAIKFSKPGTEIQINWGKDQNGPWCSVSDQGPGIPETEIPRLFQRFSKLSNRPTAGESSSGLGLYIVKVLLDATDASIQVETELGKGTTFRIRFPR